MYLYKMPAVDFFEGMIPVGEDMEVPEGWEPTAIDVLWVEGLGECSRLGFGHDMIAGTAHYFGLPSPEQTRIGVAWKQVNNGDTIVYSPERLQYLDEYEVAETDPNTGELVRVKYDD